MADVLQILADGATLLLAIAAIVVWLVSRRRVARRLMARAYTKALSAALLPHRERIPWKGSVRALRHTMLNSVGDRQSSRTYTPAQEVSALSGLLSGDHASNSFPDPRRLYQASEGYRLAAAAIDHSPTLRLTASDATASEHVRAREMQHLLRRASMFVPMQLEDDTLAQIAKTLGCRLLAVPPALGSKRTIDSVSTTLLDGWHGPAAQPFRDLANFTGSASWGMADEALSDELTRLVVEYAQRRVDEGGGELDYNGTLVRLAGWRLERHTASPAIRLHLLVQRTSYAAMVVTNGRLDLWKNVDDNREYDLLRPLCLDRHLSDPSKSPTANSIAVHLQLFSSDGYLVLVERAPESSWAPGLLNSAANGSIELTDDGGDINAHGEVDPVRSIIREAHEEVGSHLHLSSQVISGRMLGLDVGEEQVTPYLTFESRSHLTFEEMVQGHFAHASPEHGAFEVGEEFWGLPVLEHDPSEWMGWMRVHEDKMSRPAKMGLVLALAHRATPDELSQGWDAAKPPMSTGIRIRKKIPSSGRDTD